METYGLISFRGIVEGVVRDDGATIPFAPDNTDYQQFLKDWKNGAEVLDADGNPLPYSDEALAALEVK
jgi:hypothetical protein